jgi:hypothetical protein
LLQQDLGVQRLRKLELGMPEKSLSCLRVCLA